jgi:hypothetical protein
MASDKKSSFEGKQTGPVQKAGQDTTQIRLQAGLGHKIAKAAQKGNKPIERDASKPDRSRD